MPSFTALSRIRPPDFSLRFESTIAEATPARSTPKSDRAAALEANWRGWLATLFPRYVSAGFAPRHADFWAWIWALERGTRPESFIGIWPRGGAKSTSAELGVVAAGCREARGYALYICETQEQADDHVQNVAALLESPDLARYYPDMAERLVSKFGASKGWRRNRLRTATGFTVDAIGLDTAARGVKLEDARPDLLVFDDIDGGLDSAHVTARKIKTITRALLPAGSADAAALGMQNKIIPDGIFARLADGRADFLANRRLSGPYPAVAGLVIEDVPQPDGRIRFRVAEGVATWAGQDLAICERQINDWGKSAFLAEAQHEVDDAAGGMFDHLDYRHCHRSEVPDLLRTSVWCDPAVTNTDDSDCCAVQGDGLAPDGTIYRLRSKEWRASPEEVLAYAILLAVEIGSPTVGVETDQGGDTWESVYKRAVDALKKDGRLSGRIPRFRSAKAGQGYGPKAHRASQMVPDYERGEIVHVIGTHETLERALRRFPKAKPFDLTEAGFWSWADLRGQLKDGPKVAPAMGVQGTVVPTRPY